MFEENARCRVIVEGRNAGRGKGGIFSRVRAALVLRHEQDFGGLQSIQLYAEVARFQFGRRKFACRNVRVSDAYAPILDINRCKIIICFVLKEIGLDNGAGRYDARYLAVINSSPLTGSLLVCSTIATL